MFPFGFLIPVSLVLLFSAAAAVFGYIGGGALAFAWLLTFAALLGAMLVIDGHGGLRRTGTGLLAASALGLALAIGIVPAHASAVADLVWRGPGMGGDFVSLPSDTLQLIAAPAGDTGFWSALNGYIATGLAAIVTAFVAWASKEVATHTKIKIRTDQEAQVRETLKTGAYAAMHDLELYVDDQWTPAQRQKVIDRMVAWGEQRAAAQLKKLGLPNFVITAMAHKVLGQLQGVTGGFDPIDAAVTGTGFTGNPGETPALDRVVGPAMGGN